MGIRMFLQISWFVFLEGHQPLVFIILDFLENSFYEKWKLSDRCVRMA